MNSNIQNLIKTSCLFGMIGILLLLSACNRSQDQVDFEREAFQIPKNFTETNEHGDILDKDNDDWRIGPMFQGSVEVFIPAFPNPTQNEIVEIELDIIGSRTVHGYRAQAFYDMFDISSRRTLDEFPDPLQPGRLIISIDPRYFDRHGTYSNAREVNDGLHRLFIFDQQDNLITYGDIKLE